MERTEESLKARVREAPLADRLKECVSRIANMCAERRGPKMTIPLQYYDDDFFICTTLNDALDAMQPAPASETVESVTTWANETFGAATVLAQIMRAEKEWLELKSLLGNGTSLDKLAEEAADVCICLYRVIGTLDPEAINKKMAKNRARKWKVDGQGCAQHVGE